MKLIQKIVAFFFVALLLSNLLFPSGLVAYFKINQAAIAEEHCVNIERPQLDCGGKCYLAQQLKETESPNNDPVQNTKEVRTVWLTFVVNEDVSLFDADDADQTFSYYNLQLPEGVSYPVFHPPCFS